MNEIVQIDVYQESHGEAIEALLKSRNLWYTFTMEDWTGETDDLIPQVHIWLDILGLTLGELVELLETLPFPYGLYGPVSGSVVFHECVNWEEHRALLGISLEEYQFAFPRAKRHSRAIAWNAPPAGNGWDLEDLTLPLYCGRVITVHKQVMSHQ